MDMNIKEKKNSYNNFISFFPLNVFSTRYIAQHVKAFFPPTSDFRFFAIDEKQDIFLHIKKTKDTEVQKYTVISQFEQGCISLSS